MKKQENPVIADLMASIKVINADYVAKLPAEKFIMKIKKTITEDVAIPLPFYRKSKCHAYMVYSKDRCVQLCHGLDDSATIQLCSPKLAWHGYLTHDCTESEFMELYDKTLLTIQQIFKRKMKNILTIAITFLSLGAVAQSDYDTGFRNGYPDGYCYADFTCIAPITPITPLPFIGEDTESYQAGYNRGLIEGMEDRREDDMIRKELYEPNK